MVQEGRTFEATLPPTALHIPELMFATAWIYFVAFWTYSSLSASSPVLFIAFSIPFWVVGAGYGAAPSPSILQQKIVRVVW